MQTNKERIYEFIDYYFTGNPENGASTQYIAKVLNLQRTNVSSMLSALTTEGRIQKSNGRPVLYYIPGEERRKADDCFVNLVGYDGSLRRAVQLAKAAVLYPDKSLPTLIGGAQGTGKSFLAMLMHRFAIASGVLLPDAFFVTFDCQNYAENEQSALNELFGAGDGEGCIAAAKGGVLFIDNAHLLSARARNSIASYIEQTQQEGDEKRTPMIIVGCDTKNRVASEEFAAHLPIVIELPLLSERPISERLEFIRSFLTLESARLKKTLCINSELLRCLLLYDCEANCMQLKGDIKLGCANAYVREHESEDSVYHLYLSDFDHRVRKGFLKYRLHQEEIERTIPADYNYSFSETTMKMSAIDKDKLTYANMYDKLERKTVLLASRGLEESDINLVLSTDVENMLRNYQKELARQTVNKEQLALHVDKRLIGLVETFLDTASAKLERSFPSAVFCGLCLHLNALVEHRPSGKRIPQRQIAEVIENYQTEYSLSTRFASRLEETFGLKLPVDEIVLITTFISYRTQFSDTADKPVVLFAFYGEGVAISIAGTVIAHTQLDNVFAFEAVFEKEPQEIYDSLKQYITNIDRGQGVIAVYDGSFLGRMFSSIEEELHIPIRQRPMPAITLGIEFARRAAMEDDIDQAYQLTVQSMDAYEMDFKRTIVTLCSTGEGGAQELKQYIRQYGCVDDMEIVALAASDRGRLREELSEIMRTGIIHCVVGTYDPKLFALPFLSVGDIFGVEKEKLPGLLRKGNEEKDAIDYSEVFHYLDEQMENIRSDKLRKVLPQVMEGINEKIHALSLDSEVGLFIHIACSVDRLCGGKPTPVNVHRKVILAQYELQFKELLRLLKPLERAFSIVFSDDEAANILTIIYKL